MEVSAQPLTVLVVDDEINLREAIADCLLRSGYRTVLAANGSEALAALSSSPVDILISDFNLPEFSGIDLLREVKKQRGKEVSVVLVSAVADRIFEEGLELGAEAVFDKPFNENALVGLVNKIADRKAGAYNRSLRESALLDAQLLTQSGRAEVCQILNVGFGGALLLATQSGITVGDHLTFRLFPTGTKPVEGQVEVRWLLPQANQESLFGIQFIHLESNSKRNWLELVNTLLTTDSQNTID